MKKLDRETIKIIVLSLILCFLTFFQDAFYNFCNFNTVLLVIKIKRIIFSLFIVVLLFLVFLAVSKKTWKAILILSIFLFVLMSVNQIKIIYTDDPLELTDVLFLGNSSELIDIVNESFGKTIQLYLPYMSGYIAIMVMINIIAYKYSIEISNKKYRVIMLCIPIIILIILFLPNKFITNSMLDIVFDVEKRTDYTRITAKKEELSSNGVISGMYQQFLESKIYEPDNYNEDIIEQELNNIEEIEDNSFGTPNIIVLFAESFWDVDLLEEVKFNKQITSNFNRLKNEGIFFDMTTPTYGGISVNVEFEFLTGANMMYFPQGYIPTMRAYNNDSYYNAPAITKELKKNGYRTKIVNFTPAESFNVGKFYDYISVDEKEFYTNVDKKYHKGGYVSDEYVVDKIIEEFNNKEKDEKLFYMTLSMQSHMTYLKDKYEKYDIEIDESEYSQEMNDTLVSYAQGIYDMDKQLGRLYDYIQGLEEPTIIVFYGDHLPYLKTVNGDNLLEKLKYFNTDDALVNIYRKYNTQALILANFEIEEKEIKNLSPDLLGTYIINKMDIDISKYYKWLYKYLYIIPSANHNTVIDQEGKLYYNKELQNELKEAYKLRENIQYKYFLKNK